MMRFIRRFKDIGISGMTAKWYDKNSRNHRLEEMKSYAEEVTRHIDTGSTVLEIAPGPGYLSIALARLGNYEIIGLDISEDFVQIAKKNAKEAGVPVEFRQGNVSQIPFGKNEVDFIVCSAAFKNFNDPVKALDEMNRVLKPGKTALIIDLNGSASKDDVRNYLTREMGVKGLEALFMKTTFKFLKKGAYSPEELRELISQSNFTNYKLVEDGLSIYFYLTKS